jgi:hypothetical protein
LLIERRVAQTLNVVVLPEERICHPEDLVAGEPFPPPLAMRLADLDGSFDG